MSFLVRARYQAYLNDTIGFALLSFFCLVIFNDFSVQRHLNDFSVQRHLIPKLSLNPYLKTIVLKR